LLLLTTLKCEQPLLNWSNITITYDDKSILSLGHGSVINGRVLGLLGPSGSGYYHYHYHHYHHHYHHYHYHHYHYHHYHHRYYSHHIIHH